MIDQHRAEIDQLRAAVDHLTQPSRREVVRDDGTVTPAWLPSLWDQTRQIVRRSDAAGISSATIPSPIDLDLTAARAVIAAYVKRELYRRKVKPMTSTPNQLRQLATYVEARELDNLWWHSYRYSSWARMLSGYIAESTRSPRAIRLRNTSCPNCQAHNVTVDSDDGPIVVSPILITFEAEIVRHAQCTACEFTWPRGAELESLAVSVAG